MHSHGHIQDKLYREKIASEDKEFLKTALAGIDPNKPYSFDKLSGLYQYRNKEVAARIFYECMLAGFHHTQGLCVIVGTNLKDEIFKILKKTPKTDESTFDILQSIFRFDRNGNRQLLGQVFYQQRYARRCDPKRGLLLKVQNEIIQRRLAFKAAEPSEFAITEKDFPLLNKGKSTLQPFDGVHEKDYGARETYLHKGDDFFTEEKFRLITPARRPVTTEKKAAPTPAQNGNHHEQAATKKILNGQTRGYEIGDYHQVDEQKDNSNGFTDPLLGRPTTTTKFSAPRQVATTLLAFIGVKDDSTSDPSEREMTVMNGTYRHPSQPG